LNTNNYNNAYSKFQTSKGQHIETNNEDEEIKKPLEVKSNESSIIHSSFYTSPFI